MSEPREFYVTVRSAVDVTLRGVNNPNVKIGEKILVREVDIGQDDEMLILARHAVRAGSDRSSFAQWAEWAHDQASEEQK